MFESISKMWAAFTIVLLLIMGVFIYLIQFDRTIENNITDITMEFVNECQTTGKISTQNYSMFTKKIYRTGRYEIEMEYKSLTAWPEYDSAGNCIGYKRDYYSIPTEDILDSMYQSTQNVDYAMKNGDILTVTVRRKGTTTTRVMMNLFHVDMEDTMVVRYSGEIGNSLQLN